MSHDCGEIIITPGDYEVTSLSVGHGEILIEVVEEQVRVIAQDGYEVLPAPTPDAYAHRFLVTAGETLSGHRAVVMYDGTAFYAQPELTSYFQTIAITLGAVMVGSTGTVQALGLLTEPSWNWDTTKAIWLAPNGVLTQTLPTSGLQWKLATALTQTTILWSPEPRPISL